MGSSSNNSKASGNNVVVVSPQTPWRTFCSASSVVGSIGGGGVDSSSIEEPSTFGCRVLGLGRLVDPSPIEEPSVLGGLELEPGCPLDTSSKEEPSIGTSSSGETRGFLAAELSSTSIGTSSSLVCCLTSEAGAGAGAG